MTEAGVRSLGGEDSLEKGRAMHSSVPLWRISWTEERSRLQPMGSQRVGQDQASNIHFLWKDYDRVHNQDILPQNMAIWHSKHFKLEESEKRQVQEELSGLPLKQVSSSSGESRPPYTGGNQHSYLLRKGAAERSLSGRELVHFPSVPHRPHSLCLTLPFQDRPLGVNQA